MTEMKSYQHNQLQIVKESVVAEAFDIVKEEHKEMQIDEPAEGYAGSSHCKGKQRAPPGEQHEADPLYNFGPLDNVPKSINNQRSLSLALFDTLKLNCTAARYEKQLRQELKVWMWIHPLNLDRNHLNLLRSQDKNDRVRLGCQSNYN